MFAVVTVLVIVDTHVVVAALSGVLWFVVLFPTGCLLILVHGEALLPLWKPVTSILAAKQDLIDDLVETKGTSDLPLLPAKKQNEREMVPLVEGMGCDLEQYTVYKVVGKTVAFGDKRPWVSMVDSWWWSLRSTVLLA